MNDFAEQIDPQGITQELINKFTAEKIELNDDSEVVYKHKGYRFFTIDIKNTPRKKLDAILRECERIEKCCWTAQENFFEYAKKRNIITYAVHDDRIIGFQIASYWIVDDVFIFDLDETMIMKEHRGKNLAMTLSCINCRTYILRIRKLKTIRKMTFVGLTPNLRLVNLLDRIRYFIYFLDSTFNPSNKLLKIHDYLIFEKGESLVHKEFPFYLKSVFPGSLKPADHTHKTSKRILKTLPPGLDFNGRGDAFLFLCLFDKFRILPVMVLLLFKGMGTGIIFNKKLGLFSKHKYSYVFSFFIKDKSLFVERRKSKSRKAKKIISQVDFVERRKAEVF